MPLHTSTNKEVKLMTNDTNTLNGALQELGETMADNLTTMGVPSTYL